MNRCLHSLDAPLIPQSFGRGALVWHADWGLGRILFPARWEQGWDVVARGWLVDFEERGQMTCFERSLSLVLPAAQEISDNG